MIDTLLKRRATLLHRTPGDPDEYGNPQWEDTPVADVPCELQQVGSREENDTAVQVTTWQVFLHKQAQNARGWDALQIDGDLYELEGDPWPVRNPRTDQVNHLQVQARRTA